MEKMAKPFMTLKECCDYTGLSVYSLRNGVKDGTIPHITRGTKYLINVPLLLDLLDRESKANIAEGRRP